MAVRYSGQECGSCGSTKFTYIEKLNMWKCDYCGSMIERLEEPDSLFTIKNVVRQVLIDVSYGRFSEAKKNLVECEKIDPRYIGTTIARIVFYLNAGMYYCSAEQEKRNMFAQVKKYHAALDAAGEDVTEEEQALYDSLDSAEAVGMLILVYDTLREDKRLDALFPMFVPEEVYSLELNTNLLRYMLSRGKTEFVDRIVSNCDNIDKRAAIQLLLSEYPDTERKVFNCSLLLSQGVLTRDDRGITEEYLRGSADSFDTKYGIACAALSSACAPSVSCIMDTVISRADDCSKVTGILDIIMSGKLFDPEVYTIVEYALEKCSQDVALYIFEQLRRTGQYVSLNHHHFVLLIENRAISYEYKKKIIDIALSFNVSDKIREQFVSYYLNNYGDEPDKRRDFIVYLFGLISNLSTVSAERYIIYVTLDGGRKPEIVRMIFSMDINISFFRETFDKYVMNNSDDRETASKIIDILSEAGLKLSETCLIRLLTDSSFTEEKRLRILNGVMNGARYFSALDKYLLAVPPSEFSAEIFGRLVDLADSISSEAFVKYLLGIRDAEASKPVHAAKLSAKCRLPVMTQSCRVSHLGADIECGLIQAYILLTPDAPSVSCSVADALGAGRMKLNTDISVSGVRKKFKKYLSGVRDRLGGSSAAVARYLGLL